MKYYFYLLLFFCCMKVSAQQPTISGHVVIWNSKTKTGKVQYVANAEVIAAKANPERTDYKGYFKLTFVGIGSFDSVSFVVNEPGLVVVNKDKLKAIAGQHPIVEITMARPQDLIDARLAVSGTSSSTMFDYLRSKEDANNAQIAKALQKVPDSIGRMTETEWRQLQVVGTVSKIDRQSRYMAKVYGAFDQDNASPDFRKAFQLFQDGQVDLAVKALEKVNTENSITIIKLQTADTNTYLYPKAKLIELDKKIKDKGELLLFEARLFVLQFEFDRASTTYTRLFRLDRLHPDYLFDYAYFLDGLNQRDSAMYYYNRALTQYQLKSSLYERQIATTLRSLGILYARKGDLATAEAKLMDALVIWKQLVKADAERYARDISGTYNNLAIIHMQQNYPTKALDDYTHALNWLRRLEKDDPAGYAVDEADTKNNLGLFYDYQNDFSHADTAFNEALHIYSGMKDNNLEITQAKIANTQTNLGNIYEKNNYHEKAIEFYEKALGTYQELIKKNPGAFLPDEEAVLNNLVDVYKSERNFTKAEDICQNAMKIDLQLAKTDTASYNPDIASLNISLGFVYESESKPEDVKKAIVVFLKALHIWQNLDLDTYDKEIAAAENDLAMAYFLDGDFVKAKYFYNQSVSAFRLLAKKDAEEFNPYLANVLNNRGYFYQSQKDFKDAKSDYLEALNLRKDLYKQDPDQFGPDEAKTENNLGSVCIALNEYGEAEYYLLPAFRSFIDLQATDPGNFSVNATEAADNLVNSYYGMLDSAKYNSFRNQEPGHFSTIEDDMVSQSRKDNNLALKLGAYYSDRAWYLLFASRFAEAQHAAEKGLEIAPAEIWIKTNLAHALLFQGKYAEALAIYTRLKGLKDPNGTPYVKSIQADFDELKKQGLTNKDVKKIRKFLNE